MLMRKLFLFLLFCVFCGCSSSSTTQNVHSGRITSQQGFPVILYPQEKACPPPAYCWPTPQKPIITEYSFHCQGASLSLETADDTLYDCDGFAHSLYNNFPIYPRLIEITRVLNYHFPLSIREGFCCQKHFRFLQASGKSLSPKHLQGAAVLIWTAETLSFDTLRPSLASLYKKNIVYPIPTEFSIAGTTLYNGEFSITLTPDSLGTWIAIELLYDLETSRKLLS